MGVTCHRCKKRLDTLDAIWLRSDGTESVLSGDPYHASCARPAEPESKQIPSQPQDLVKKTGAGLTMLEGIKKDIFELPLSPAGKPAIFRAAIVYGMNPPEMFLTMEPHKAMDWIMDRLPTINLDFWSRDQDYSGDPTMYPYMKGRLANRIATIVLVEIS